MTLCIGLIGAGIMGADHAQIFAHQKRVKSAADAMSVHNVANDLHREWSVTRSTTSLAYMPQEF